MPIFQDLTGFTRFSPGQGICAARACPRKGALKTCQVCQKNQSETSPDEKFGLALFRQFCIILMENQHNEAKPQLELIPAVAGFKSLHTNTRVLYPDAVSFFTISTFDNLTWLQN
jgi:hypothetical protein